MEKEKKIADAIGLKYGHPLRASPFKREDSGRSMVEMLGVLAIIGILSAGALTGYSKAMFRHKVNQTIDIFQGVLQSFSEVEQKGWGKGIEIGSGGNGAAEDMIAYGIYPECQKIEEESGDTFCQLPIGRLYMAFLDSINLGAVSGEFTLFFNDSNSCIAFSSIDWVNAVPVEWWNPNGYLMIGSKVIYAPNRTFSESVTNVEMADIIEGCRSSNTPDFYLVIRSEL